MSHAMAAEQQLKPKQKDREEHAGVEGRIGLRTHKRSVEKRAHAEEACACINNYLRPKKTKRLKTLIINDYLRKG